ncbi:MAG: IS630 transposase-related protein [Candidatus Bathyarchaeota archaeon]|uniref:helix-turn-helix domain-containing protein n=1 Tax=Candidatus Bathycorpusculum sp. TaxID=2994959 RepID=UPI00281AA4A6|nr:IS630 transposase-related protein [Candidatus Termiticorpusculum sp.]MCL2291659.1 IS630 transposase-related protein [Candidatus Termiticorpusculum sp.]
MPRAITLEEREKIIKHKQNNENETDIARWLFISQSTVTKLWAHYRKTGNLQTNYKNCGRNPKITDIQITLIKAEIEKNPDTTLMELIEKLDLSITESGLSRLFKKLGLTFKKRRFMLMGKNEQMS